MTLAIVIAILTLAACVLMSRIVDRHFPPQGTPVDAAPVVESMAPDPKDAAVAAAQAEAADWRSKRDSVSVQLATTLALLADRDATIAQLTADPVLRVPHDALFDKACALVRQMEADGPTTDGGEWRRAQVYGRLLKAFPNSSKSAIALAIEAAVQATYGPGHV